MKRKLLFLILVLTINMNWSQNNWELFQGAEDELNQEYRLILLNDDSKMLSKIVTEFNSIQDDDFVISPNPSKDKLNIKLPKSSENMVLEVFDVLGKRIHKATITQLEASVDVSRWKTGVYLVKVSSDKESQTKRFIKQ